MTPQLIVTYLTPVLVPLIISAKKALFPKIPTWVLPILAPILGVVLDLINNYATNSHPNFLIAAVLGLAGVGVREIVDQLKSTTEPVAAPKP